MDKVCRWSHDGSRGAEGLEHSRIYAYQGPLIGEQGDDVVQHGVVRAVSVAQQPPQRRKARLRKRDRLLYLPRPARTSMHPPCVSNPCTSVKCATPLPSHGIHPPLVPGIMWQ